jgi:multicomponent Na+:H+ antiporter subunit B
MNWYLAEMLSAALVVCALALVGVRSLFASVALLSAYSGLLALLFAELGAVDVAFTEAVVGAGVSTVLFIALLRRVDPQTVPRRAPVQRLLAAAAVAGLVAVLLLGVGGLPAAGDPHAPASVHVAPEYAARSIEDMQTPNVVTAVLGDYRGFDTLIETAVILAAAVGCAVLLGGRR